jgi:hypothetical protein
MHESIHEIMSVTREPRMGQSKGRYQSENGGEKGAAHGNLIGSRTAASKIDDE